MENEKKKKQKRKRPVKNKKAEKAAKREVKISSLSQEKVDKDRVYHQTIVDDIKKYGGAAVNLTFRSTQRNQVKNMKEFERLKLLRKEAREKKKKESERKRKRERK